MTATTFQPDRTLLDAMGCADRRQPAPARPRPNDDNYRTPPECGRALASVVDLQAGVWECCAGDGWLAAGLADALGPSAVTATTLHPPIGAVHPVEAGVDMLTETTARRVHIVTNPPYSKMMGKRLPRAGAACAVIAHALELLEAAGDRAGVLACLLDLRFRLSVDRNAPGGLLWEFPPTSIHAFADRVTMYPPLAPGSKGNQGTAAFAWFVWERPFRRPGGHSELRVDLNSRAFRLDGDAERFGSPRIGSRKRQDR